MVKTLILANSRGIVMRKLLYEVQEPKTLEEMTWEEAGTHLKETEICTVSTGAIEQHGYHLPLNCDTLIVQEMAKRAAEKLESEGIQILVGPTIHFGVNPEAMNYPGSVTLRPETHKNLIKDICISLHHHGIKKIVFLMGHDGNWPVMTMAAQELITETDLEIICVNWLLAIEKHERELLSLQKADGHGGAGETSRALASFPNLVHLERARGYFPPFSKSKKVPYSMPPLLGGGVYNPKSTRSKFTPFEYPGQVGDPKLATKEAGEQVYALLAEWLADVINQQFLGK